MLQSQLVTQEWQASKLEHVAIMPDGHCAAVEELLVAMTSAGHGFGARLGTGLDSCAKMVPRGEWDGIRAMQEEVSEDKYE